MKKKTITAIVIFLIVLIVGLVFAKKKGFLGDSSEQTAVDFLKLDVVNIDETVTATGKIQPEIEVKLSSEVSGEVIALPVVEGQEVKKGDLLIRINPDIYQSSFKRSLAGLANVKAQLNQAEASLIEAQQGFDRSKKLYEKGIIAASDWEKANSGFQVANATKEAAFHNVRSANATVSEARDNLARTTIYAPRDGTISSLSIELGERVVGTQQMTGTELMRLANLLNMEVEVDVNENDIVKLTLGDSAVVEVDAYLKKEFKGIVTEIANSAVSNLSADQVTNFKVKVRILEESYKDLKVNKPSSYTPFRPGMTATVAIITDKRKKVIGIPIGAILIREDTLTRKQRLENKEKTLVSKSKSSEKLECVYVKSGDKARLRIVTTGIQDDTNIEIIDGLEAGETIVTGPYNTITKLLENGDGIMEKKEEKE